MNCATPSRIEPLENRIAPATLSFVDVDGDKVLITTSGSGTLTEGDNVLITDGQLTMLNLSGFDIGTTVSIIATKADGGDGFVNVGMIMANGLDLGSVTVDGDLGKIVAGSGSDTTSAITALKVHSLGMLGTVSGADNLTSQITGKIDKLTVTTDVVGVDFRATDIGTVSIGGDLIGGDNTFAGHLYASNAIGTVKIGGDLIGGSAAGAGLISGDHGVGDITIQGSIIGGGGEESGALRADLPGATLGNIVVGGDVLGGTADHSARIYAAGGIGSISIGGDFRGGASPNSARIYTPGAAGVGAITIGGNMIGGPQSNSGMIDVPHGPLTSLTVKGDLRGGGVSGSGFVSVGGDVGAIKILGDFDGGSEGSAGSILVSGNVASLKVGGDIGIGSGEIQVGGTMGAVKIGGDVARPISIDGNVQSVTIGGGVAEFAEIALGGTSGLIKIGKGVHAPLTVLGDALDGILIGGNATDVINIGDSTDTHPETPETVEPAVISDAGSIQIGGSLLGGAVRVSGELASLSIGKDVIGGNDTGTGIVQTVGDLHSVKIGGNVIGNFYSATGAIGSGGVLGPVTIGKNLVGGNNISTGIIVGNTGIVSIKIGGSVLGGAGMDSGVIATGSGDIGTVKIGGDLVGGSGRFSGSVIANIISFFTPNDFDANVGKVTIGGNLIGGTLDANAGEDLFASGMIAGNNIAGVSIGKNIRGGYDFNTDYSSFQNASILAADTLGAVKVKGSIRGTSTSTGTVLPSIGASGDTPAEPGATTHVVFKSLTVGRDVEYASIGTDSMNGGEQMGAVKVGGNWVASRLAVGVDDGADDIFGTSDDFGLATSGGLVSRIASITIGGRVFGTSVSGDEFGFVAQEIGSLTIGGTRISLNPIDTTTPANGVTQLALGTTKDVVAVLALPSV